MNSAFSKKISAVLIGLALSSSTTVFAFENTNVGTGAGANQGGSAEDNVNVGENAGNANASGDYNTMVGKNAGLINTTSDNTFIGANSGENNATGTDNVFIGARAGQANTTADNVFIGTEAGKSNTTGQDNTFVGEEAGEYNTEADNNTFIGEDAGHLNTTGENNTFVGSNAGAGGDNYYDTYALTGHNNTTVGEESGYDLKLMASRNSLFGSAAGTDIGEGLANTMIGSEAGNNTEFADFNTFIGALAGWDNNRSNETNLANRNTALGALAGFANRKGEDNVWIGAFAHSQSSSYSYDSTLETDMQYRSNGTGHAIYGNTPAGNDSIYRTTVLGAFAGSNDNDSVSIGYGAITDQTNSVALGAASSAKGNSDIAIGTGAASSHTEAIAIGYQAVSHRNYAVTIGNVNTIAWDSGADGTTSLGTAADCVYDDDYDIWSCNDQYRFSDVNTEEVSLIGDTGVSTSIHFWADNGEDYDDRWDILVADSGTFSIGSYATSEFRQYRGETIRRVELFSLDNTGNATLSGGLTLNSDERLKENINTIANALQLVQKITGVTYDWKKNLGRSKEKQYGLIAQNVEAVIPELVAEDDEGIKSVNYQALIPVLINATQEQQKQIDEQKTLIDKQQKQIEQLIQLLSSK
ncbi:MAG: tail fiber domain-containing protein [Kangiellaceae bacterium]|nr:tail fiber domain-containing protein [Kangiellaceae bacterium]